MGFLSTIGTAAVGLVAALAAAEFSACAPSWARRIVRRAARSLPESERTASEVEWLAHIEDTPGNLSKMLQACGLWRMVAAQKIDPKALLLATYEWMTRDLVQITFGMIGAISNSIAFGLFFDLFTRHKDYFTIFFLLLSPLLAIVSVYLSVKVLHRRRKERLTSYKS